MASLRNGVRAVLLTLLPLSALATTVVIWFTTGVEGTGTKLALSLSMGAMVLLNGHQKVWANYLRGFGVREAGGTGRGPLGRRARGGPSRPCSCMQRGSWSPSPASPERSWPWPSGSRSR